MNMQNLDTPVLLIIFNYPEITQKVFNAIKEVKPKSLFVFSDAPRKNKKGEAEKCSKTRKILEQIDWACDVKTYFLEENIGARKAVSTAISWFFDNVEEGIVLEHDCLPNKSFFYFCQEMLNRYRNDTRIMHISGSNFLQGKKIGKYSYYFSKVPLIWGFATWKRAWKFYDVDIKTFPEFKETNQIENIFNGKFVNKHIIKLLNKVYKNIAQTWDHQWRYAVITQNGLCINPNVNLVSNIGFGPDALHCANSKSKKANIPTQELYELTHPIFMIPSKKANEFLFKNHYYFGFWAKFRREFARIFKLYNG